MTDTIIDLMRHGEPEGGRAYRGHNIDDSLSEKGWQQMWHAVGDSCPWHHIITSPLSRCHAFARALAEDNNLSLEVEDDFKEVGFGSWEGKTPDQIRNDNLKEYEDFYQDPVYCRPPGAEHLDDFIRRTTDTYQKIINEHQGEHVLVVCHAGVIRSIIAHTLHAEPAGMYRIKVTNGGITRIRVNQQGGTLELLNQSL